MLPAGGHDDTPYRLVTTDGVRTVEAAGRRFLEVDPALLTLLTAEAMRDIAHLLRPGHLHAAAGDPRRPRGVAQRPLRRPRPAARTRRIAAGGVLPSCQDTGTAIVMGKQGELVLTGGGDEAAIARGIFDTYQTSNLRYSQMAPLDMYREVTPATTCRPRSRSTRPPGDAYKFLFMAKGGGSANKSYLFQETKALLNPDSLMRFLDEKLRTLGTAGVPAVPPRDRHRRHVGRVRAQGREVRVGALPRHLPTEGNALGRGFRDVELEQKVLELTQQFGIGAQFGGKYFCHDVRVVRLPRHGASCPVAIAVSCSADRQALGKITADGVFLEELERDPAQFLPEVTEDDLDAR